MFQVNTVAWAPSEYGLIFACGSSDGSISIVSLTGDGSWQPRKIENAHPVSSNTVVELKRKLGKIT